MRRRSVLQHPVSAEPPDAIGMTEAVPAGEAENRAGGVTARAVLIALILLVAISPIALYVELVRNLAYNFMALVPPIAQLAVLFLLAALNPLLARRRWWGLSRREILSVYAVLIVAGPLMSHGNLLWWSSCSMGVRYFGRAAPQWEKTFFQYIPGWFHPTDVTAVEDYFQGHAAVPWALWAIPLLAWGSFFIALFIANLSLLLMLKRQWIRNERLTFPIAMVPLEAVREQDAGGLRIGHLPASWTFWIGFLIAVWLGIQTRLPRFFPWFPAIPIGETVLIPWQKVGPLAGLGDIWLVLYPEIIALAYLIPKELSFSVWFFWIVRVGLCVIAIAAGAMPRKPEEWYGTSFPAPYYQGGGALLALGGWGLWMAWPHLARVGRSALTGRRSSEESEEPFRYRAVSLAFLLSYGYMVYFCWAAGCRIVVGVALIGLIIAWHMVWARLRAETGMSFIGFPFQVDEMMRQPFGSAVYRPAELITISALRWASFPGWGESCEVITGGALDSLKIADSARISQRRLTSAVTAGFILALAVGAPMVIWANYHWGFLQLHTPTGWLEGMVRGTGVELFDNMTNPTQPDITRIIALGAGAAVTLFLGLMRLRFWWWPFHPVGYIAANVWGSQWWYMPLFVGWACKSLVIRYGGLRLYQRTIPAAIGAIIGSQLVSVVWTVIEGLVRALMR